MKRGTMPEVSLVVPVLNEADSLPILLENLSRQRDVIFEVVVCDGGSTDQTLALLEVCKTPFPMRVIRGEKGRGRQMNLGAGQARARNLLFFHADTFFAGPFCLGEAVQAFERGLEKTGNERLAGHFPLRFLRRDSRPSLSYFFYECKTRLNRPGCINGDQGFLMRRVFFKELGGFNEDLGFMEDELLARKIFAEGGWLLLPGEVLTSARRFESEGLYERQFLNALIMNFSNIGWTSFLARAPGIYREQKHNGRLELGPFLRIIVDLLKNEPLKKRLALWYRTGAYVNRNAWQAAFFLDVRRAFKHNLPLESSATPKLDFFDAIVEPFIHHPAGFAATGILTWAWFCLFRFRLWTRAFFKN